MIADDHIKSWFESILTKAYRDPEAFNLAGPIVALQIAEDLLQSRGMDGIPVDFCVERALETLIPPLSRQPPDDLPYQFAKAYGEHWKAVESSYDPIEALKSGHMKTSEFVRLFERMSQEQNLPLAWSVGEEQEGRYLIGLATLSFLRGEFVARFTIRTSPDFHSPLTARVVIISGKSMKSDLEYRKLLGRQVWSLRGTSHATHLEKVRLAFDEILGFTKLIIDELATFPAQRSE